MVTAHSKLTFPGKQESINGWHVDVQTTGRKPFCGHVGGTQAISANFFRSRKSHQYWEVIACARGPNLGHVDAVIHAVLASTTIRPSS